MTAFVCGRGATYFPVIIENQERYRVDKNTLEYNYENITLKVKGSAVLYPAYFWKTNFEIKVMNRSQDTLIIAYENIGALYPYHAGKHMTKSVYKKHKELNIVKEPFLKIYPHSEEIVKVNFKLEEGRSYSDRHHVFTFYINDIRKPASGETFKFIGDFKM